MSCKNCKIWNGREFPEKNRIHNYIHYQHIDDPVIQIHYVKCGKCDQLYSDTTSKKHFVLKIATKKYKKQFIILQLASQLNSFTHLY